MLLWFGHGCSSHRMLLEHERYYGLGMDARTLLSLCMEALYSHRMLLEHERYYGLGMDALVTVCSWNTNVLMVWAWICAGHRMLMQHRHPRTLKNIENLCGS